MYYGFITCTLAMEHVLWSWYMYHGHSTCTKAIVFVVLWLYMYYGHNLDIIQHHLDMFPKHGAHVWCNLGWGLGAEAPC